MVLFKYACTCGLSPCRHDRNVYWKLGFSQKMNLTEMDRWLQKQGYHRRKNMSKDTAMRTIGRCQRHLLLYRKYTLKELRTFCKDRRLTPKHQNSSSHSYTLEQADDEPTFDQFLDLPPELRNAIYETHLSVFSSPRKTPPATHHINIQPAAQRNPRALL